MHYLIDGHNLIGKLPDISLSDPDDEVQLVLRLRGWTAVSPKRRVTVYFDGGIPGGRNVKLSTTQVQVVFATAGKTADALLIRHINKVKNPPEFTLVTSDQAIIKTAVARKMKYLRSETFAPSLAETGAARLTPAEPEDPALSEDEVQEWLELFGPVDEEALRQRPKPVLPRAKAAASQEKPKPEAEEHKPVIPASSNREDPQMSETELAEWLALFDGQPEASAKSSGERGGGKRPSKPETPNNLDDDDLAAWQDFIGHDD